MNKGAVKRVRKLLIEKTAEVLVIIRNDVGSRSKEMGPRQIYQHAKRLYKNGKLNKLIKQK